MLITSEKSSLPAYMVHTVPRSPTVLRGARGKRARGPGAHELKLQRGAGMKGARGVAPGGRAWARAASQPATAAAMTRWSDCCPAASVPQPARAPCPRPRPCAPALPPRAAYFVVLLW